MPKKRQSGGTTIRISGPRTGEVLAALARVQAAPVPPVLDDAARLANIRTIIDCVESRCMAADGPVTNTRYEMTDRELREIYVLAGGKVQP